MPHSAPPRTDARLASDPAERPLPEIGGDIRDRLAVLLNATQLIRLGSEDGNPAIQSGLRLIERQVHELRQLADEICRAREPGNGPDAAVSDRNGFDPIVCSASPGAE